MTHARTALAGLVVALAAVGGAVLGDRIVLAIVLRSHAASPQLSLAAAMAGLFTGGLVALIAILIAFRHPARPRL